jgi:hypothetical protein
LSWNDLWLTNFENNVWRPDSSSKMTANTVNRLIQWHLPEKVFMKFRSQIENQVSDYRLLYASRLAHLTQRVRWAIVTTDRLSSVRPYVNFSYFNQLLWSHWANLNQALVEWSLDGPLPKLCLVIPTSNQDGHQAKNRKKRGWNFNCPLLV